MRKIKIPKKYLKDEATVFSFSGRSAFSAVYSSSSLTVKGHFEVKNQVITDSEGREIVSSGAFFTDSENALNIKKEDKMLIRGRPYEVLTIDEYSIFGKIHHVVIFVKSIEAPEEEEEEEENGEEEGGE
mgnify:CR=1 FL=1